MSSPVPNNSSTRGVVRGVLLVGAFALTFVAMTLFLRGWLPVGERALLRGKLAAFEEQDQSDPFDVVFIGSSRIYHGLIPELFDQRMEQRGHPTHSFNLGITGLRVDGAWGTLRSLAARKPTGLRYVLIDPEDVRLMLTQSPRSMRGSIYLHDPVSSRLLLTYLWNSDVELEQKRVITFNIVEACALDAFNVGRGLQWVRPLLGEAVSEEDLAFRIGLRADGWRSKDRLPKKRSAEKHRKFIADPAGWQAKVNKLKGGGANSESLRDSALPLLTRLETLVRELGGEPIFISSPSSTGSEQLELAQAAGHITTLFQFSDPARFPELFTVESRWEAAHLSEAGAVDFSNLLADRLADWIEAQGDDEQ